MSRRATTRWEAAWGLIVFMAILLLPAIEVQRATEGIRAPAPLPEQPSVQIATPVASAAPTPSPVAPEPAPTPVLHVGIQSGHLQACDVPDELSALKCSWGVSGDGWDEVVVNHQIAQKVADILLRDGLRVDILPTTIPEGYKADVFVALHADGFEGDPSVRGFKVARAVWSRQPTVDDALVGDLISYFQAATGLPENANTITDNMTEYYAFDSAKYRHAVSASTPAAIIEMGFLTNADDRDLLLNHQDRAAGGIATAVLAFLGRPDRTGQ